MGRKYEDLMNQTFFNWKVIRKDDSRSTVHWICESLCEHKVQKSIAANHLKKGDFTKKCAKCEDDIKKNKVEVISIKKTRLLNKEFGNLKVTKFYGYNKNKQILYECECKCINRTKVIATYTDLVSGKKDNCGCLTHVRRSVSSKKYNTYDLTGEYGIGYTQKDEEFYFDLEDYGKIKNYCWYIHFGYMEARSLENRKNIKMHRLIMDISDKNIKVDHIFHKTNDNRKSELRVCSNAENCANHILHSNNTSGKSGITFRTDTNKWRVRLWKDNKCYNIGQFETYEEAVIARDDAEIEHFEEFRYDEGGCINE